MSLPKDIWRKPFKDWTDGQLESALYIGGAKMREIAGELARREVLAALRTAIVTNDGRVDRGWARQYLDNRWGREANG